MLQQYQPHGSIPFLLVNLFHSKKKTFLSLCFSICVVFSNIFHVLVKLSDFVVYACEDTSPLKFGGVVFLSTCVYACVVCCIKLCYLIFVYGFENLMKIN